METKVISVDPRTLVLLKTNARFMRHETFSRLVENLKKDGELTQLPFCALLNYFKDGDEITLDEKSKPVYEVLSGNHRVQGAIAAGFKKIKVQVCDEPLTPDQRKGIQLSHNEISGEDDPSVLKMIYESIDNVDMRIYSGLDDKKLELLDKVTPGSLNEVNLEFQTISMVFLPDEKDRVVEVFDVAKKAIAGAKGAWITRWAEYDKTMEALEIAGRAEGVKNVGTALMVILDIFLSHKEELKSGFLDKDNNRVDGFAPFRTVPLEVLVGSEFIPVRVASLVGKAIDKIIGTGKAKKPIEAFEIVFVEYLKSLNNKD